MAIVRRAGHSLAHARVQVGDIARFAIGSLLAPSAGMASQSDLHQALTDLVRADPKFAIELAYRAANLLPLVGRYEVRVLGNDVRLPTSNHGDRHLRPDLVLGLYVDNVLHEIWIAEVQLHRVAAKPAVIAAYRAAAQLHYQVPAYSLALSPKPKIRKWLARKTELDPDAPVIPEPRHFAHASDDEARSRPHACLLRAFFHADDPEGPHALPILKLALRAARALPLPERRRYTSMLLQFTEPTMTENLQAYLRELTDEPEPDEWDRSRAGWHRAHLEGKLEGELEGRRVGKLEGRIEGRIEALLDILELRGLTLDEASRTAIRTCTDLALVERWYARAKQVATLDDLFAPAENQ